MSTQNVGAKVNMSMQNDRRIEFAPVGNDLWAPLNEREHEKKEGAYFHTKRLCLTTDRPTTTAAAIIALPVSDHCLNGATTSSSLSHLLLASSTRVSCLNQASWCAWKTITVSVAVVAAFNLVRLDNIPF